MNRQDMERELSMKFRRADSALKRRIERRVKDTGVYRSQHRLLMQLSRNPGSSQAELAEKLEVSPAAIAVSLRKLENGGYIRRETAARDSRVHQVIITPKGREVIEHSIVLFQKTEAEMFAGFSDAELQNLEGYLERIWSNLTCSEGEERE